jgi:hypothetical protein
MKNKSVLCLVAGLSAVMVTLDVSTTSYAIPATDGVFGLESTGGQAWLAVRLEVSMSSALSGILWYNNDGQTVLPRILVGAGYAEGPGAVAEFVEVASTVSGPSSGWAQTDFDPPVAAATGSLYVAFELPANELLTARGAGGGPGIGYGQEGSGALGWLSGDGEEWARLHEDYRFAVVAQFVPRTPDLLVKSLQGAVRLEQGEIAIPPQPYLAAGPNPFNPQTVLRFGITREQAVDLAIYDLRGRRVARLLAGVLAAGEHRVTWLGQDDGGRDVASGVYFVKFAGEEMQQTQKILLLR